MLPRKVVCKVRSPAKAIIVIALESKRHGELK